MSLTRRKTLFFSLAGIVILAVAIPLGITLADEPAGDAAAEVAPPPPAATASDVAVTIGDVLYAGDGRMGEVPITVTNLNVYPRLATGRYHIGYAPEDNTETKWVTLLGAIHDRIPHPYIGTEPLWKATVTFEDGYTFPAYAGCIYRETIFAQGDEPLDRAAGIWFHWETTLEGGWFDCGNEYQVKPENLLAGESATIPLTIYFVHPREWEDVYFVDLKVTHIDLELMDTLGRSLGVVASRSY